VSAIVVPASPLSRFVAYGIPVGFAPVEVDPADSYGAIQVRAAGFGVRLAGDQWAVLLPAIFAELPVNLRAEVLAAIHRGARA
jgi:hypothetical protein